MYPHKVNGVVKFPDQSLFRFFFFGFPIETNFDHTSYWITRLSDFGTLKKKLVNQIYMCKHVIDRDSGPSECPNTSTPDTIKLPAWETAPLCVEEWQLWRRRKVFFFLWEKTDAFSCDRFTLSSFITLRPKGNNNTVHSIVYPPQYPSFQK